MNLAINFYRFREQQPPIIHILPIILGSTTVTQP